MRRPAISPAPFVFSKSYEAQPQTPSWQHSPHSLQPQTPVSQQPQAQRPQQELRELSFEPASRRVLARANPATRANTDALTKHNLRNMI